jgi:2-methylcitrate dehydratase PrpD
MSKENNTAPSHTAKFAGIVCAKGYDALDDAAITAVKRLILDGVAVAVAGTAEDAPKIVAAHTRDTGGAAQSTLWGFGCKVPASAAAYANAVSMHVLDFEPMSSPPTHAVSPTVPVALALAEARGGSGREVIAACAKGFEIQGRILAAAKPARGALPFHSPGVMGPMGSAVAAAHMLMLDAAQLANALGMASSRCAGLPANSGSMVKCTHCGNAAAAGLEAALLAARGFTANPAIFEAKHGYVQTFFAAHFDYDVLFEFGTPWRCVDPGMAIKFYPSKYPTHFAISAALDARKTIRDVSQIRSVRIVSPEILDANRPQPRVGLEGKFSIQYAAAAALLDGAVGIQTFTDQRRFAADMENLLGKIALEFDTNIPPDTKNMHMTVEVTLADGSVHRGMCRKPPGTWGIAVDAAQHRAKIRDCLAVRFDAARIDRVIESFQHLERLDAQQLKGLLDLLA